AALAGDGPVTFVATALPGDAEMDARISMHRADRPAGWTTIEPGPDLPAAIRAVAAGATILLDGLTLWLSQLVDDAADVPSLVAGPVEDLRAALAAHDG